MSATSQEENKKVKVTFIELETMFVETDAANFMSLVQKLTGKEPSNSKANNNKENAMPIKLKPQERRSIVQSKKEVCIANGGAKDAVDEVVAWMAELEPHLDELCDIINEPMIDVCANFLNE
jgi:hypothetical protein